jgi:hypothetical protein
MAKIWAERLASELLSDSQFNAKAIDQGFCWIEHVSLINERLSFLGLDQMPGQEESWLRWLK